jgi:hypothetical protein
MATGGTPGPGPVRVAAAIGVAGGPKAQPGSKGVGKPAKMPGLHPGPNSAKNSAALDVKADLAESRRAQAKAPARAPAAPRPYNPQTANAGEMERHFTGVVNKNTQAELGPFRQRQGEITNTEGTVSKAYGGYGEQFQNQMGNLQTQAQGNAKTFENHVAESTLQATKGIETTGQNAITANAGYLDPQLRAALSNQSSNIAATGQAQLGAAQAQGQGMQNYLTALRGAAGARVLEGQRGIATTYGKQRGEVGAKENQLIARKPGEISRLTEQGMKTQFNQRAAEQGLGIKLGTLGVAQQNAQTKAADAAAKARGAAEGHKLTERGQNITAENYKKTDEYRKAGLAEKERVDASNAQYKRFQESHGGKGPSAKEANTYAANISKAEGIARQLLGTEPRSKTKQASVRAELIKKGASADTVSAALNLVAYGRLGPIDQQVAKNYGLTPQMRPQWFRTH